MLLRRLLDNLAIGVEAFATCRVARGWRLRLPSLDWVTIHYVLEGEGQIGERADSLLTLPAGSLAVVPAHLVHVLQCGEPPFGETPVREGPIESSSLPVHRSGPADEAALLVACGRVTITYAGKLGLFDHLREVLVLKFSGNPRMRIAFASLLEEVSGDRIGSSDMKSALMRECLIFMLRELCEQDDCRIPWLEAIGDPSMASVLEAMLTRPGDPHSVNTLAEKAYMSRSAFAARFRETFGLPPLTYLRGIRLRHAARLLKESPDLSIATVARRSGFASRSQFSRTFHSQFGRPPSEFRD